MNKTTGNWILERNISLLYKDPVEQIRSMIPEGRGGRVVVQKQFNISRQLLCDILHGRAVVPRRVLRKLGWRRVWAYERVESKQ